MHFEIPREFEPKIQQVADSEHISEQEALDRIIRAGLELFVSKAQHPPASYASLFGAAKSGYGSREAIDRAIAEMRSEW